MNKYVERLYNGIVKENPSLVLMLGMCPTLAVTTSAINGIGMGLSTLAVLIFSNYHIVYIGLAECLVINSSIQGRHGGVNSIVMREADSIRTYFPVGSSAGCKLLFGNFVLCEQIDAA